METVNQNCDEQLKIVVRQREYSVSKKFICSVVPYFEKMFCCDLLESKENKVTLDFDERVFDSILDWIHTESFTIQMDYVISLYDAADYLMINDSLLKPCFSYFHENFTIEHLPIVLPQVTPLSKLINSEAIENFICRHFLTIVNTDIFLDYPMETVQAILKLDLMVYSEFQIFEAIIKWITKDVFTREESLQQLLDCVRWYLVDTKDKKLMLETTFNSRRCFANLLNFCCCSRGHRFLLDEELIESIETRSNILPRDEWRFDRSKQDAFISIKQKDSSKLQINIFDDELCCLPIGDFRRDDLMSLEFVHGEHISDILFDLGRKRIRINWNKKKFRVIDMKIPDFNYHRSLFRCISKFSSNRSFSMYLEDKDKIIPEWKGDDISTVDYLLLEVNGEFILIGKTYSTQEWFGIFPVVDELWFTHHYANRNTFKATVLDNVVYILTKDLKFIQFNIQTCSFIKSNLFEDNKLIFDDLLLTSHAKNADKVILVNKSSGKVYFYCTNTKKWVYKCQIMNANLWSNGLNADLNKLIAFTSTFLSMKVIKPLYRRDVN